MNFFEIMKYFLWAIINKQMRAVDGNLTFPFPWP